MALLIDQYRRKRVYMNICNGIAIVVSLGLFFLTAIAVGIFVSQMFISFFI